MMPKQSCPDQANPTGKDQPPFEGWQDNRRIDQTTDAQEAHPDEHHAACQQPTHNPGPPSRQDHAALSSR